MGALEGFRELVRKKANESREVLGERAYSMYISEVNKCDSLEQLISLSDISLYISHLKWIKYQDSATSGLGNVDYQTLSICKEKESQSSQRLTANIEYIEDDFEGIQFIDEDEDDDYYFEGQDIEEMEKTEETEEDGSLYDDEPEDDFDGIQFIEEDEDDGYYFEGQDLEDSEKNVESTEEDDLYDEEPEEFDGKFDDKFDDNMWYIDEDDGGTEDGQEYDTDLEGPEDNDPYESLYGEDDDLFIDDIEYIDDEGEYINEDRDGSELADDVDESGNEDALYDDEYDTEPSGEYYLEDEEYDLDLDDAEYDIKDSEDGAASEDDADYYNDDDEYNILDNDYDLDLSDRDFEGTKNNYGLEDALKDRQNQERFNSSPSIKPSDNEGMQIFRDQKANNTFNALFGLRHKVQRRK